MRVGVFASEEFSGTSSVVKSMGVYWALVGLLVAGLFEVVEKDNALCKLSSLHGRALVVCALGLATSELSRKPHIPP